MQISRRRAMLGASAAAVVAGVPLAIKAAGVKAALAGDPVLALEREWLAQLDFIHNYPDDSDEALDPLFERANEIERQLFSMPAGHARLLLEREHVVAQSCHNAVGGLRRTPLVRAALYLRNKKIRTPASPVAAGRPHLNQGLLPRRASTWAPPTRASGRARAIPSSTKPRAR